LQCRELKVIRLVNHGALVLDFVLLAHAGRALALMEKYSDLPMDFADACLVVMTERFSDCQVVALDRADFFHLPPAWPGGHSGNLSRSGSGFVPAAVRGRFVKGLAGLIQGQPALDLPRQTWFAGRVG